MEDKNTNKPVQSPELAFSPSPDAASGSTGTAAGLTSGPAPGSKKKSKKGKKKISRQKQQILFTAIAAAAGWVLGVILSLNVLFLLGLVCLSAWAVYVGYAVTGAESNTENAQLISKDPQADVDRWCGTNIHDPRLDQK